MQEKNYTTKLTLCWISLNLILCSYVRRGRYMCTYYVLNCERKKQFAKNRLFFMFIHRKEP